MVREGINDDHVTVSSIALLQERFKQLQRMKELRKERELVIRTMDVNSETVKVLTSSSSSSSSASHQQHHMFLSPPTYPYCQLSLSLCCPDHHYSQTTKHADSRGMKLQALSKSLSAHSPTFNLQTSDHKINDIDTSLRL